MTIAAWHSLASCFSTLCSTTCFFEMHLSAYRFPVDLFCRSFTRPYMPTPRYWMNSKSLGCIASSACISVSSAALSRMRSRRLNRCLSKASRSMRSTCATGLDTVTLADRGSSSSSARSPKYMPEVYDMITSAEPLLRTSVVPLVSR